MASVWIGSHDSLPERRMRFVSLLQYTRVPVLGRGRENTFWCICPFFKPLRPGSRTLPSPRKPPSVFGQWQILVFIRDCVTIVSALIWRNMPWEIVRIRGLIPGEREEQLTAFRMRVKLGASYLRNAVKRDGNTWFSNVVVDNRTRCFNTIYIIVLQWCFPYNMS